MKSNNGAQQIPAPGKSNKDGRNPPADSFEGAACIRALICFAKASGPLTPYELAVLEEAWDKLALPATITLSALLNEGIDLTVQLGLISSEEGRERTYTATYLFAHSGGPCSTKQQELLNSVHTALHISDKMATPLSRIYGEVRKLAFPALNRFIADATERSDKVNSEILRFSLNNAVTGAFPAVMRSVATGIIIFSTQSAMVGEIAHYWGFTLDKESARILMARIQGEAGMRIAIQSLLRDVSALDSTLDSTSAFETTWALGNVANKHFESGRKLDEKSLRDLYITALHDAGPACQSQHDEIAGAVQSRSLTLELLNEELTGGSINSEEYDRKLMGLQ